MVASLEEATIDQLLNESQRKWSKDIIDGISASEEVEYIYKIPLSSIALEDSVF